MITCLKLGYGGRLANQMFQVASVIGLADRFRHDFAFPYWKNFEHKDRFGSTEDIDVQKFFKNKLPVLSETDGFQDLLIEFNTSPDTELYIHGNGCKYNITQQWSGHLQSEKWFAHRKDSVRHYFEFDESMLGVLVSVGDNFNDCCGIHLRVGDYANADSMQPVLGPDYYFKAIEKFPTAKFAIFSDDKDSAMKLFNPVASKDPGRFLFLNRNHTIADLYFMTRCQNMIIGNSTYSWWGAWLNKNPDKRIVAPSTWWTEKTVAQWGYSTKDLYPEGWIVI